MARMARFLNPLRLSPLSVAPFLLAAAAIAWAASGASGSAVYFNTPTERNADGSVRAAGGIVRMNLPGGTLDPVSTGLHYPSGLAFGSDGVLYFGDVSYGPFSIQLME